MDTNIFIPEGLKIEPQEIEVAELFAGLGKRVEFIVPIRTIGSRNPDIQMDGVMWEIKTPLGDSRNTILNAVKRGSRQSHSIIIDLRKTKISDNRAMSDIKNSVQKSRSIKRVLVILKTSQIIAL